MDMHNLTYDKLQKNIVQAKKKHFPNNLASLVFIRERVIVTETRRNPGTITAAKMAFAGASTSNTEYLMANNK